MGAHARNLHCYISIVLLCGLVRAGALFSADISFVVKGADRKAVKDAVAYAVLLGPDGVPVTQVSTATMDQRDKEFVPYVLPVQAGTVITFPNSDNISHHVYSFSPAKKFELPLYKDKPAAPVVFDKPGVVVLGCNIHDWMLAYIYVLETPYFSKTDGSGRTTIQNIPSGTYDVRVWHPQMKERTEETGRRIKVDQEGKKEISFSISLKPKLHSQRQQFQNSGSYR